MGWIAGADGCRTGWFRVARNRATGELRFDLIRDAAGLLARPPQPELLALDIPIGLPSKGARACDLAARRLLGKSRSSSVFPAPVRPALAARSHLEASEITRRVDGRGVSAQAWGLFPKIRAVDAWLREASEARQRVREVHPELSFQVWNRGAPMSAPKKTSAGRRERHALAAAWLGTGILERGRGAHRKAQAGDDDLLDAIAALWTAHRIAEGTAARLPEAPQEDEAGLLMEIVY